MATKYPLTLRRIRAALKARRCADALREYRKLPENVRYRDSMGPLKARINRCAKGR